MAITPEEMRAQRVTTFKSQIAKMIATSKEALVKTNSRETFKNRIRENYSKEEIHRIVTEGTAVEKAELSEYFFSISGLYKRIVLHYATFLFYSWLLIPHIKKFGDKMKDKKIQKIYHDAAEFCSSFGIEHKCSLFAKEVLVKGGYYGIIHDNGEDIAIQDLPFEFCRSRFKNHQDINIIEFDMRFFDTIRDEGLRKEILKTYPKVVQKGYRDFKNGKDSWIYLPSEIGIYFSFFEESPFFLDLIPLLDDLEDYKALDKQRKTQALKRIIAAEVPHDGMNLVFEPEEAAEMHQGVCDMLAENPDVDVVTSYNKISLLDLSGRAEDNVEVQQMQQLIYDSAGVSKELFSANTDAGLNFSLNNDLSMMMILGQIFAHFFSILIDNKFGNKKIAFKISILPISYYNSFDYTSKAKDLAAFGYSVLTPILSTGVNQANLADLKELENTVLKLDEALKPLQSAYTQSGKTNAITAQTAKNAEKEEKDKKNEEEETKEEVTTDEERTDKSDAES